MVKYYKVVEGEYIVAIGTGIGGTQITEEEYNRILQVIYDGPVAGAGYEYRLKTDLTWELVELPTNEGSLDQTDDILSKEETVT